MWYPAVRRVFEDFCPPSGSREARDAGAQKFVQSFKRDLGLAYNADGRPVVREPKFRAGEFSLRGLAESICGYEWVEALGRSTGEDFKVFEAGQVGITPANLPNVSAFLGSVVGLLDSALIEAYDTPEYIIDSLVETLPSKTRQKKLLGTGRIGDQSKRRNPGEPHPFASFEERYITTPETQNDALALAVTQEAVFFDQTGEVLDKATKVADELRLRKELDGFKVLAGVVNPYNYRGVAYNTYLTTGNWINDQINVLEDWTDINAVNSLCSRMTDQESGNRITPSWDTILVSPTKEMTAKYIDAATEIETQTAAGTQVRRSPKLGDKYKILSSVYLDQVLTTAAPEGLAQTQANADEYWWCLNTAKGKSAFVCVENWPFTVNRATPNSFTMLNHKMMLAVFVDQMHVFACREPRYVIRNRSV